MGAGHYAGHARTVEQAVLVPHAARPLKQHVVRVVPRKRVVREVTLQKPKMATRHIGINFRIAEIIGTKKV